MTNPKQEKCRCGSVQFNYNGDCLSCGLKREQRWLLPTKSSEATPKQECCEKCKANPEDSADFCQGDCPCHTPTPIPEEWEMEFDKEFVDKGVPRLEVEPPYKVGKRNYTGEHYIYPGHKIRSGQSPAEIKRFIKSLLLAEKGRVMKEERIRIQLRVESLMSMSWRLQDGSITEPTLSKREVMEILLQDNVDLK